MLKRIYLDTCAVQRPLDDTLSSERCSNFDDKDYVQVHRQLAEKLTLDDIFGGEDHLTEK